jgi:putative molybdopterin biosynthesis protein
VHLLDASTGRYNEHLLEPGLSLVRGWERMQGVVFRSGDKRFEGQPAVDAIERARTEPGCVMVNRNAGAGTRILIDRLLGGMRPAGYSNQPRSHNAVAAAVSQGRADWGVAIQSVAAIYGLGFLPIAPEQYDFLLVDARREHGAVQAFLAALRDPEVRARISALGMRPA